MCALWASEDKDFGIWTETKGLLNEVSAVVLSNKIPDLRVQMYQRGKLFYEELRVCIDDN